MNRSPRAATLLLCAFCAAACTRRQAPPVERAWPAMGSFAAVSLPAADAQRVDQAAALARDSVDAIERELSAFLPGSTVVRLNQAAGAGNAIPLPPHGAAIFALAEEGHRLSQGAFDPTVGPYLRIWGFRGTNAPAAVPTAAQRAAAASRVGWQRVERRDGSARLPLAGMELDFGGIAKGYAVDIAFDRLRQSGLSAVLVNLGGNLRACGAARPGRPGWRIAVRNPFLPYGEGRIGTLILSGGRATATSGRYERFVEIGGRRYAHVIDPRSGEPVGGLAQVTVLAGSAGEADALSTALFVLGPREGAALLRATPRVQALFVPDPPPGQVPRALASPGFLEQFTPAAEWAGRIAPLLPPPT